MEISQLAQVRMSSSRNATEEIIKRINRVMTYAVDNPVSLKFPKLDLQSLQVVGFSDAGLRIAMT